MARKHSEGWYLFENGYYVWFHGLSAQEKKYEILQHGKIIRYTPTY